MREKTWKILSPEFDQDGHVSLICANCGCDAQCPTHGQPGAMIIAVIGMGIVFDPPGHVPPDDWLPPEIQCRNCKTVYSD